MIILFLLLLLLLYYYTQTQTHTHTHMSHNKHTHTDTDTHTHTHKQTHTHTHTWKAILSRVNPPTPIPLSTSRLSRKCHPCPQYSCFFQLLISHYIHAPYQPPRYLPRCLVCRQYPLAELGPPPLPEPLQLMPPQSQVSRQAVIFVNNTGW
jgi:hypothetical protein